MPFVELEPVEGEEFGLLSIVFLTMFYTTETFLYHDFNFMSVGESVATGLEVVTKSTIPMPHITFSMWALFHLHKVPAKYGQFGCQNSAHCDGCKMIRRREARHRAHRKFRR